MAQKRNILLCFLVISIAACITTTAKRADFILQMDGFHDYSWGTPVKETGSAFIRQGYDELRDVEWFTKKDDLLSIGKATLNDINYVFRDGTLSAVSITAHGISNYEALREELINKLGKSQLEDGKTLTWNLDYTSIFFTYNDQSEIVMLILSERI